MKNILLILSLSTSFILGNSDSYCINQYNKTLEALQKTIANNKAEREFYAKIEANVFQDRLIDLRLKCSESKNETIQPFLRDSIKAEEALVTLELLKHVSK